MADDVQEQFEAQQHQAAGAPQQEQVAELASGQQPSAAPPSSFGAPPSSFIGQAESASTPEERRKVVQGLDTVGVYGIPSKIFTNVLWAGQDIAKKGAPGIAPEPPKAEGQKLLDDAAKSGVPSSEIDQYKQQKSQEAIAAGVSPAEVAKYWGDVPAPTNELEATIQDNIARNKPGDTPVNPITHVPDRPATGVWDAFASAIDMGPTGLVTSDPTGKPVAVPTTMKQILGAGVGDLISQAPFIVGGQAAGMLAGVPGDAATANPLPSLIAGNIGGAFAPELVRGIMEDYYKNGHTTTSGGVIDAIWRATKMAAAAGMSAPIGYKAGKVVSGIAGKTAGSLVDAGTNVAAITTLNSAFGGKLPNLEDFENAGILVAGLTLGHKAFDVSGKFIAQAQAAAVTAKLTKIHTDIGLNPIDVIGAAQRDPALLDQLVATSPDGPGNSVAPSLPTPGNPPPYDQTKIAPHLDTQAGSKVTEVAKDLGKQQTDIPPAQNPDPVPQTRGAFADIAQQATKGEDLLPIFTKIESAGNPNAISYKYDPGTGQVMHVVEGQNIHHPVTGELLQPGDKIPVAFGKNQITPATARTYGRDPSQLLNEKYNDESAKIILNKLYDQYGWTDPKTGAKGGDLEKIGVAYNGGPGMAARWERSGRDMRVLPRETQDYIAKIRRLTGGEGLDTNGKTSMSPKAPPSRGSTPLPGDYDENPSKQLSPEIMRQWGDRPLEERMGAFKEEATRYVRESGDAAIGDPYHTALTEASDGKFDPKTAQESVDWATRNGREDIAQAIAERAERAASKAQAKVEASAPEKVAGEVPEGMEAPTDNPKIKAIAKLQAERSAEARGEKVAGSPASSFSSIAEREAAEATANAKTMRAKAGSPDDRHFGEPLPGGEKPVEEPTEPPATAPAAPAAPAITPPRPPPRPLADLQADSRKFYGKLEPDQQLGWFKRFYIQNISRLGGATYLDRMLAKNGYDTNTRADIEDAWRLAKRSNQVLSTFMEKGVVSGPVGKETVINDNSFKKAADAVMKDGGDSQGWIDYMVAKRANLKEDQGMQTGHPLSRADREDLITQSDKQYARGTDYLQKTFDGVLDFAKDRGLFSQHQIDQMKFQNPIYVSMQALTDQRTGVAGRYKGATGQGINGQIKDPLSTMIGNMYDIIRSARDNAAVQRTHDLLTQAGLMDGSWVKELGPVKDIDSTAPQGMAAQLSMRGNSLHNKYVVINDGIATAFDARCPEMAALMRGADSHDANVVVNVVRAASSFMRAGITNAASFVPRMMYKHFFTGFVLDPVHPIPGASMLEGILHRITEPGAYADFQARGGGGNSMSAQDIDARAIDINSVFEKTGIDKKIWNTVTSPLEWANLVGKRADAAKFHPYRSWQDALASVDNTQRFGYTYLAKNRGISEDKAVAMSHTAFMDHLDMGMSSISTSFATANPFWQEMLRGLDQGKRAFQDHPFKTSFYMGLFGTMAVYNYAYNYLKDQQLPEDSPDRFDNQSIPMQDGYWNLLGIKLPVPWVIGQPVNGAVRRTLDELTKNDPHAWDDWAHGLFGDLTKNPLQIGALTPFIEHATNYSFHNNLPLQSDRQMSYDPELRQTPATTPVSKWVAMNLTKLDIHASPIVMDNYVKGLTGSLGQGALEMLGREIEPENVGRPWQISDNPIYGAFFFRKPGMSAKPIQDFYTSYRELAEAKASKQQAMKLMKEGSMEYEQAQKYLEDPEGFAKFDRDAKALSTLHEIILGIQNSPDVPMDQKQQEIDKNLSNALLIARAADEGMQTVIRLSKEKRP